MRKTSISKNASVPMLVAILMMVLQCVRIAWLARLPDSLLVQHIPDDAFYYLVLAKNYVATGRWTFDGVSSSTGFHLLWAYFLAAIYKIFPAISFKEIFGLSTLISALSLSIAAGLSVASVRRIYGLQSGWPAIAILFSAVSMLQATWMMESSFVILMASLLLFQISSDTKTASPSEIGIAVTLGFLGSMARSDYGLLPFWLFVTCAVLAGMERRWMSHAKIALCQLIGACIGVVTVFVHTRIISGHFIQASAQTKLWWGSVQGKSFGGALRIGENLLSPFYNAVVPFEHTFWSGHLASFIEHRSRTLLLIIVLGGILRSFWISKRSRPSVFTACMLLLIASYCFVYGFDGAIQNWYVANYEIPIVILAAAAWSSIPVRWLPAGRILVIALTLSGFLFSLYPTAPWQEAMYRSGLYIRQHPELKPVGAWNSGVMDYFGGGGVVNLDGLVDDDLVPHIMNGTLANYVAQRGIGYIIESPSIFTPLYAKRSGIEDGKLYSCIRDKKILFPDDPFDNFDNTHITLFRVDDECIRKAYLH